MAARGIVVGLVLSLPLWGVVVLVIVLVWPQPAAKSVPYYVSVAASVESAVMPERAAPRESAMATERAGVRESAEQAERAVVIESAVMTERADVGEGAAKVKRAVSDKSADPAERAAVVEGADKEERPAIARESTETHERADPAESAEILEQASPIECADPEERAACEESAEANERAASEESADTKEQPRIKTGYPQILSPTHHLWDDQQAGWPDHLPHQAWRATAYRQQRDEMPRASSADHPAFDAGYTPNYVASPELPSPGYVAQRQGKARR